MVRAPGSKIGHLTSGGHITNCGITITKDWKQVGASCRLCKRCKMNHY